MIRKHRQINHMEETENLQWCIFKVPQYTWKSIVGFYIVSSYFYKKSKQATVPTFVWLFRDDATTAKGPVYNEGTNLR